MYEKIERRLPKPVLRQMIFRTKVNDSSLNSMFRKRKMLKGYDRTDKKAAIIKSQPVIEGL